MGWYLNPALSRFRAAVNVAYPQRDKTSDGTIGDPAHQATTSDHNPDPVGEPDAGSVDAWDMDVDLRSDDDAAAIEELKRVFQTHESSRYWIHNRQIASRSTGWRRAAYTGSNPHDKHVHWNTRESHENSTAPWTIKGGDVSLTPGQEGALGVAYQAGHSAITGEVRTPAAGSDPGGAEVWQTKVLVTIVEKLDILGAKLDGLTIPQPAAVDVEALAAALAPMLAPGVTTEEVRQVVDEELDEQSHSGADDDTTTG